jgi:hypothetical protein
MHLDLCFHFHAYQPGDVILRRAADPREPPAFAERRSPVSLKMGDADIAGDNWTDAMLRFYGSIWRLFREAGRDARSPFCSVDIEPWTLQLLAHRRPDSFWAFRELVRARLVDPVATVPFHVLLPHAEPDEQRFLSRLSFRLHDAAFPVEGAGSPLGFWFPEALYSERAARSVVQAFQERESGRGRGNGNGGRRLFFVLDGNQFLGLDYPQKAMSANYVMVDAGRVPVFGRDRPLSDRWAFRQGTIPDLVAEVAACRNDPVKEGRSVQYALTLASDLESLAGSAEQGARFLELRKALGAAGIGMLPHSEFLGRKLRGEYRSWEGELMSKDFMVRLRDFSSWSDYMDLGADYSSDTRWTGLRRWDGLVISRTSGGRRISQIWKQGFAKMHAGAARLVRKAAQESIAACSGGAGDAGAARAEEFLLGYCELVFAPLLLSSGAGGRLDFHHLLESALPDCRGEREAALAARAYSEMLMSSRSCPRFWENIDTRVTFQSVVLLASALLDIAEACGRLGLRERAAESERLYAQNLVGFHEVYRYYQLPGLFGAYGWEVTEEAWHMAVQSEIPGRSSYDVVKRAALFAALHEGTEAAGRILSCERFDQSQVTAECGHIEGESHGRWAQQAFCENRNPV